MAPYARCVFVQGNDDVYLCVKDGSSVSVSAASLSGRTHPEDQSQVTLNTVVVSFLYKDADFLLDKMHLQ